MGLPSTSMHRSATAGDGCPPCRRSRMPAISAGVETFSLPWATASSSCILRRRWVDSSPSQ